jgi:hypothetical protein
MANASVSPIKGTGKSLVSVPKDPRIQQIFNELQQGAQKGVGSSLSQISGLAGGGTPEMWEQLEAPALRQFGAAQGSLASRFSQGGARRSSGFANSGSAASMELAERLQSNRLGLQQGAQKQLLDLYQQLLGTDLEDTFSIDKKKSNRWGGALSGASSGALGGSAFGPIGAGIGAGIGGIAGFFAGK